MNFIDLLKKSGISPSAQRLAVAQFVLSTERHPSADEVLEAVQRRFPLISRATVYNTLNTFVAQGLLRQLTLSEGSVVFDPNLSPHHHFVDDISGAIEDVPWHSIKVSSVEKLDGYQVREYMVVLKGTKKGMRPPTSDVVKTPKRAKKRSAPR